MELKELGVWGRNPPAGWIQEAAQRWAVLAKRAALVALTGAGTSSAHRPCRALRRRCSRLSGRIPIRPSPRSSPALFASRASR